MACNVARVKKDFEEKGYTGSKTIYRLLSFFITKTIN